MEIQLLLNMIDPRSCATEHLVRGASILVEAGRGGEAAFLADAALRRDDHREEVLCVASRICLEHGASTEALELCREWSRLAPRDPRPLATMGAIHQERSETDQLIRVDRLLLDLAPDNSREIRLRLLDNLIATGEAAEAREQYNLLREAGTPSLRSDMAEAGLLYLEADFERASECVRKILETDAQNCVALKIRGKIQLEQLQASDAITTFRRLVELAPDDYEGHYLLGQAYAQSGDMEQAQRHLRIHREILNF
jgi:tetratricopeptide (TPR) repeat protein